MARSGRGRPRATEANNRMVAPHGARRSPRLNGNLPAQEQANAEDQAGDHNQAPPQADAVDQENIDGQNVDEQNVDHENADRQANTRGSGSNG